VLLALVLGLLLAWPAGRGLGAFTARVSDPWRRFFYLGPVWLIAAGMLFVLPHLLLEVTFRVLEPDHAGAMVCVALVWPQFVLVPLVGIAVAVRRVRKLGVELRQAGAA
jgi:hypothetical protein